MYSCSEVTQWIATDEFRSARLFKRVGVALHLMMCRHCSGYAKQLKALAHAFRKLMKEGEIPAPEIEAIRTRLLGQILQKS